MIESAGGESIKGESVRDPALVEVGRRVAETLGIVGPATVQCFRTAPGRYEVTDVNLRFGGAFPLPLAAGSRYPELALALARGEHPEPRLGEYREGVVMTRWLGETTLVRDGDGFAPLEATAGDERQIPLDVEPPSPPVQDGASSTERERGHTLLPE
jgi:carbamoyl-phosphate synthase large subunit